MEISGKLRKFRGDCDLLGYCTSWNEAANIAKNECLGRLNLRSSRPEESIK